ncbi:hypothetical protein Barb6_03776 [Bacteroidales bacterium Barb6]|nr:hypothetical protein Barb6_03776 [Bacteroidales bacterium Barb6]OAV76250.1 hypothetical protein Barb7_00105 [Bacteroidales bacterium Barb7]
MRKIDDLTGKRFGRLTVVGRDFKNKWGDLSWLCRCDCGNEKSVRTGRLNSGNTASCGCLRNEKSEKHVSSQRLYRIWHNIKSRCMNKNFTCFNYYGGRGIKICDEWKDDYKAFHDWAMSNGYSENLNIDRIDNNGNYEPANCRFSTQKKQNRNTRKNVMIEHNGETKCTSEWAEMHGIEPHVFSTRIRRGWSFDRAVSKEIRKYTAK